MSLDLEDGDEELANATPAERRAAARKAASEQSKHKDSAKASRARSSSSSSRTTAEERVATELRSRLDRTFDRIAQMLHARGDDELAGAILEDRDAMSQGIVSLTRNVRALRSPLLMVLNLVEPALAFGRVGRILYMRYVDHRQRVTQERQEAASSPVAPTP